MLNIKDGESMYGLNGRNEEKEMRERYNAMVNVLSDIFSCGRWDIEDLFDSENNFEVGEITKRWVEENGSLPDRNTIYYETMLDFVSEHELEMGVDVDIYTNDCLDTHIYAREGLDEEIIKEMENLFNMNVKTLNY